MQFQKTGPDGFVLDMLANPQRQEGQHDLRRHVLPGRRQHLEADRHVRVDVPDDCVPRGAGVLRVSTYTQEKNGSGPGYSEDTMRVKGTVTLR